MNEIKLMTLLLLLTLSQFSIAKEKLQIIHANSKTVDIRDGKELRKGDWTISPETKPDVYTTSNRKVTFYTDLDSITFKINPKVETYDFIILLNGKDSAYTQIKYSLPFIDKLKKGEKYNYHDSRFVPKFT